MHCGGARCGQCGILILIVSDLGLSPACCRTQKDEGPVYVIAVERAVDSASSRGPGRVQIKELPAACTLGQLDGLLALERAASQRNLPVTLLVCCALPAVPAAVAAGGAFASWMAGAEARCLPGEASHGGHGHVATDAGRRLTAAVPQVNGQEVGDDRVMCHGDKVEVVPSTRQGASLPAGFMTALAKHGLKGCYTPHSLMQQTASLR